MKLNAETRRIVKAAQASLATALTAKISQDYWLATAHDQISEANQSHWRKRLAGKKTKTASGTLAARSSRSTSH